MLEKINMRNFLFVLLGLIIMSSCLKKEEPRFQKIMYSLTNNYTDSLGVKIIPNKDYDYWAYMKYSYNYGNIKHIVLNQGGDTLQKPSIKDKSNIRGFFEGCYPNYCCNYIIVVENKKIKYLKSKQEFVKFLGDINNLEEAMLLAKTYGYILDSDLRGSSYRVKDDSYEFHLMKFHEDPPQKESVEIKIDRKGNVKTRSLGVYCRGAKCYE